MAKGAPTRPSCQMCAWSCKYERATQDISFGGEVYSVCDKHAANPIADPRTKVIDFKTENNHYGSETSAQAAHDAAESAVLNKTHYAILGALAYRPMTPDEVAGFFKMVLNTARARMTDLSNAGLIVSTGERRDTDAGKEANVMRPTQPHERESEVAA